MTPSTNPPSELRPSQALAETPRGFATLEHYSSLKRYWDFLSGFDRAGLSVRVPARTPAEHCRRSIHGIQREQAAALLDVATLQSALEEDEAVLETFNLQPTVRQAIHSLLEGDTQALCGWLNRHYRLEFELQLGFTRQRNLILKAETRFVSKTETPLEAILPSGWPLRAKRLGRDEYRVLLERASGNLSRIPR